MPFRKLFFSLVLFLLSFTGCTLIPFSSEYSELIVENNSTNEVKFLYVSPHSDSNWRDDQLESSIIKPKTIFTLKNIPFGTYDFKVVFTSGNTYDTFNDYPQGVLLISTQAWHWIVHE